MIAKCDIAPIDFYFDATLTPAKGIEEETQIEFLSMQGRLDSEKFQS